MSTSPKRVAVFGGTGFVGSAVCERLVKKGYAVTAVSRRGTNPKPGDENLDQVNWVKVSDVFMRNHESNPCFANKN